MTMPAQGFARIMALCLGIGAAIAGPAGAAPPANPAAVAALAGPAGKTGSFDGTQMPASDWTGAEWTAYVQRFVRDDGRVVDNANGNISHSESQGYGMLLAAFAGDRATFDTVWAFTKREMQVRGDGLFAWKYDPGATPHVADKNNASDGDLLIAWGLAEGYARWGNAALADEARAIAAGFWQKSVDNSVIGLMIKPGAAGFSAQERPDGPVVNLSYFVFPAFVRLAQVDPGHDWQALAQGGLRLARAARFGSPKLPTDWIAMGGDVARPADGFPAVFGFNAIRVPLYLIWAGYTDKKWLDPFAVLWLGQPQGPGVTDVATGQTVGAMAGQGYSTVENLVSCVSSGRRSVASPPGDGVDEFYYPATLHLLALVASNQRIKSCS